MTGTVNYTTQGCRLYFVDNTVSPNVIRYVDAMQDFTGLGGAAKDISITNQDSVGFEESTKGLIAVSSPQGTIIYNPNSTGYQALNTLWKAGQSGATGGASTQFMYCLGDAANTVLPTLVTGVLIAPETASPKHWARTSWGFTAYVKQLQFQAKTNDVIMSTFQSTQTGPIVQYVKGELINKSH